METRREGDPVHPTQCSPEGAGSGKWRTEALKAKAEAMWKAGNKNPDAVRTHVVPYGAL